MSRIFVISDTHFGHDNILNYSNRPFPDCEEMDWSMVKRWNSVVREEDHVWHLGDVYMGGKSKGYIDYILSNLLGKKRLVLGNHDNGRDQLLHKHFQKIVMWRVFREFNTILSHVPIHETSIIPGYTNTHGHIHTKAAPSPLHRNVSVEQIDYTPVLLGETQ